MIRALFLAVALLASCQGQPRPPAAPAPTSTAHDDLDRMDSRQPVPLLPMMALHQKEQMRDHLAVVQEVVGALAVEDWSAVESAAMRLGASPEMSQRCEHMGAAAPGFTEQALDFHRRADTIAEAARAHDAKAVLRATDDTLQACTSCHATWKQQIVSSDEYATFGTPSEHVGAPGH
jgi:hypothetical protein